MRLVVLAALLSFSVFGQQQTSGPLTNQRIIELVKAGTHPDELARMIATAPEINFNLTPAAADEMMKAGVTEDTIRAMSAREQGVGVAQASAPMYQPTPGTPVPAPEPAARSPRVDVFAGYSYLNVDTNGLTARQSLNGWGVSLAIAAAKWIAFEGDVGGYYKNNVLGSGISARDYSFLAGPRVNAGPVFVHALFGGDQLTGSSLVGSASQTGFAAAFGGGLQSKPFAGHWAIRSSADFVLSNHDLLGIASVSQHNFRVGGGIVYVFAPRGSQ